MTSPAYIYFPKGEEEKQHVLNLLSEISGKYKYPTLIPGDYSSVVFHGDAITLLSHPLELIKRKNQKYHFIELTLQEFKKQCFKYSITKGKSS